MGTFPTQQVTLGGQNLFGGQTMNKKTSVAAKETSITSTMICTYRPIPTTSILTEQGSIPISKSSFNWKGPPLYETADRDDGYKLYKIVSNTRSLFFNGLSKINKILTFIFRPIFDFFRDVRVYPIPVCFNPLTNRCDNDILWIITKNGIEWQMAIALYSPKRCDEIVSEVEVKYAIEYMISDYEVYDKLAFCVTINFKKEWWAYIRLQRNIQSPYDNVRDIPCDTKNGRSYHYEEGYLRSHGI